MLRPALLACCLLLAACDASPETRFRLLDASTTGIDFANDITVDSIHNFHHDTFIYNGAGVAVGDVDGDGRVDLYFTGNMVSSRLYLNRGGMRFEDATGAAGVATDRWATGASMVDIDGDGDLDIHVSVAGPPRSTPGERANLLFVNDGTGRFSEQAARFGLADTGFTTHAAFLDYDRDGDLDVFLLANSPEEFARGDTGQPTAEPGSANPDGFNQLYRNDGGHFVNVSEGAGLLRRLGYGLGVAVADLNRDGWPDIYVSNDITPNDVLYVNNGDGTFTDRAGEWLDHTSYAGMGVDVADLNEDGWPDIVQADMMPEGLADRKRVSGTTTPTALAALRSRGFFPQANQNTVQLNRGAGAEGRVAFSEIARMAGVAYTDWSWAVLAADFDNDGAKDLLVTNGYPKAVTDLDYQANARDAMRLRDRAQAVRFAREQMDSLPGFLVPNRIFRNSGELAFDDVSRAWGLRERAYSYGAAYVDLDDDGRLDLVVNNLDSPASIYRNEGRGEAHWLRVELRGSPPNSRGVGARVTVHAAGRSRHVEQSPYRGYLSTVDDRLHFGLGGALQVDSLRVTWPDGTTQLLGPLAADTVVVLRQDDALPPDPRPAPGEPLLSPVDAGLDHIHQTAADRSDFALQPLLPYEPSRQGPPLAVADVDGDGREDLFVGGGRGQPGRLFLQAADGSFADSGEYGPWAADADHDDWGAAFFEVNGDGLPDLYVASGGYHLSPTSPLLRDRLYLNLGGGRFEKAVDALPEMVASTATVAPADFDADGRVDLFVGGRVAPGDYPAPAPGYLLRNEGGRFTVVDDGITSGMVTGALWLDVDSDGDPDLVTAGMWMPIVVQRNDEGRFTPVEVPGSRGWWYSLAAGDLDGDGDLDLLAGNLGLNHSYAMPFGVYAADFSGDGRREIILTQGETPFHGLATLGRDFEALRMAYPTHEGFAEATTDEIFGRARLREALRYEVDGFASIRLRNEGDGTFTPEALPRLAQVAPVTAMLVDDLDGDGNPDVLLAGNLRTTEANVAPADAGKGLWLRGDGAGGLIPAESGFLASGEVRSMARVGGSVVVGNHGAALQVYRIHRFRPIP